MKRFIGILLSLALIIGLMPGMSITAYADTPYTGAVKIEYRISQSWNSFSSETIYTSLATLRKASLPTKCYMETELDKRFGWRWGSIESIDISDDTVVTGNPSEYAITVNGLGTSAVRIKYLSSGDRYFYFNNSIKVSKLETYTVTLHTNGGTISTGKEVESYIEEVGAELPSANDITKDTCIFEGWYDNDSFSGTAVSEIASTETGNKEYWAKWKKLHTHSFTYSADSNAITATCTADDCDLPENEVILTINAPLHTTFGDGKEAAATLDGLSDFNAATGKSIAASDIKYVGRDGTTYTESATAPTDAGKYTAKITVEEKTAGVDYEIAKAEATITENPIASEITYGQTLADSNLTDGTASVAGSFEWKDSTVAPSVSDSQTTEYDVVFTPEDGNYGTAECKVKLTVNEANSAVTSVPEANALTYTGSAQDLVTAGEADGGEMEYALGTDTEATENYTTSIPSATDAGTYYVWYRVTGDENHTDTDALCVEVTIEKASIEFEAQGYTGEYDGQEHGITVSVTKPETGFAIRYGTEEGKYDTDSSPSYKDAGSNNVYYEITADNFETARGYETVAISKKKLVVTANAAEKNYGEEDPELTYVSDGLVGNDEITGQLARAEGQNAGTYAIDKGTLSAGDNYEMTFEPALFTINRADAEYTAPKANELVYDGTDQALLTAGETSDGTILYSADGEGFSEEIPTGMDAGQYTVYYKVIGDENHEDTEVLPVEVAILQRGVSVTAESAEKVYGDADPEFTYRAEGLVEGDGFSGALSRQKGGSVGNYDILQGTLSAGDNYYIDFTSAYLVIHPKDIGRAAVSTKSKKYDYNGKERKPGVTAVLDGKTLKKDKDFKVTYRNNKKVGTASYTVTGIGNYTGSASGTFELTAIPVYRLFNTRTGEHFYTISGGERQVCIRNGWNDEGIAWYAPRSSDTPIYRVMNPNNKNEHFYTKSKSEKDWLVGLGWRDEGIAWYSDDAKTVPVYRHYHPVQRTGNHHYTTSKGESDHIVKYEGWKYEGISWYAAKLP